MPFDADDQPYTHGFAPGGIEFVSVRVNGESAQWGMQGESECFMRGGFCGLKAGEERAGAVYRLSAVARGRGHAGRGGYLAAERLLPGAVRVRPGDRRLNVLGAMSSVCDAYFAAMSDYTVTLEAPSEYRVAGSGTPENIDEQNGRVSWRIQAENVREIALVLSKYKEYVYDLDGVTLRVVSGSASAAKAVRETAAQVLEAYGEWFGAYPYDTLTVTQSDCLVESDSAAGVVSLNAELFSWKKRGELKTELARQLARQWFGGLVGSNPVREPWLQATLSEYASLLFTEHAQGYKAYLKQLNAQAVPALRITIPGGLNVDSAADRFTSRSEFATIVIDRGVAVMHELRETMGDEAFFEGLRLYVQANAGGIASIADFAAAIDQASGSRLDEYLVAQLETISDYAGHDVQPYE